KIVPAKDVVPPFDSFNETDNEHSRLSGYIDLNISTKTPVFIRREKEQQDFFVIGGEPIIPGSSLRGMSRTLVEIITFSRFQFFENKTLYHRKQGANAAANREMGFLYFNNGIFSIKKSSNVFQNLYDKSKEFQYTFDKENSTAMIKVYSGNMAKHHFKIEYATNGHTIEVPADVIASYEDDDTRNAEKQMEDLAQLARKPASFKEQLRNFDAKLPYIGIPVWYDSKYINGKEVAQHFGHCRNYRVHYHKNIAAHVNQNSLQQKQFDYAEAIFGFLRERREDKKEEFISRVFFEDAKNISYQYIEPTISKVLASPKPTSYQLYLEPKKHNGKKQYTTWDDDSKIRGNKLYWHKPDNSPWMETKVEFTPSDFMAMLKEYQLQEKELGNSLIRPAKEGEKYVIILADLPGKPKSAILKAIGKYESQHTVIKPIKNATFTSRIRFENLTKEELGALLFVLQLPPGCCHKLGMGKPLGLGSVEIQPTLTIIDRKKRYAQLFEGDSWYQPTISIKSKDDFIKDIEDYMLGNIPDNEKSNATTLWDVPRLKKLKTMLTFKHEGVKESDWLENTKYQELEEFKKRPVLPYPHEVVDLAKAKTTNL
ncbi:MAG: TIGR03986 family CRISPR-associated RAMP protein, partial [Ferruginibacter sp.]